MVQTNISPAKTNYLWNDSKQSKGLRLGKVCRHRVHQISYTHFKELRVVFFFPGGCSRRPDRQASSRFPSDFQSTFQKHFLPAASRQMAAHGGSKSNPALAQNNKKARKTSPATFILLQLCVCSWHQNDAKQILKNPKSNNNKKINTKTKNKQKDIEERVTRSMPDAWF